MLASAEWAAVVDGLVVVATVVVQCTDEGGFGFVGLEGCPSHRRGNFKIVMDSSLIFVCLVFGLEGCDYLGGRDEPTEGKDGGCFF